MSIELPRFAVLATNRRTATVSSFDPRKKVRVELQTVAVIWTLFKTAIYGRCAQVATSLSEILWIAMICLFWSYFSHLKSNINGTKSKVVLLI